MLKVIQWATGTVSRHAVRAVANTPGLQLVGAFGYGADKIGRDAGELCGVSPLGVPVGGDRAQILAMDADCVLYMAQGEGKRDQVLDDVCQLLASGKNVISTALTELIYPKACGPDIVARIENACAAGRVSFHATGIEPGWAAEVLPLTLSGLFRRIDRLLVQEILDYASYPSIETLERMGFGKPPRPVPPTPVALGQGGAFVAPLMMVADALGAEIEEIVYQCDVAVADHDHLAGVAQIGKGTITGKRYSFTAMVEGRPALMIEHVTRLGAEVAPDWPKGRGWYVTIEGAPSMAVRCEIGVHGEDQNDQACLATAMHAVHAIAPVCAAPTGIRTFLDLPVIMGTGALTRPA
jgi:hypothetical protein